MKKTLLFMLCALLLATGCTKAQNTPPSPDKNDPVEVTVSATGKPDEQTGAEAKRSFPSYYLYDQPGWESLEEGVMFSFDLDQDGTEEEISFRLRPDDEWATAITWGDSTAVLHIGDEFIKAEVMDLDPKSPYYNLLVVTDYGSGSYVTVELHPENGQLKEGTMIYGSYARQEGSLVFYEDTHLLGYGTGMRTYHGDELIPDSEWLTMTTIPTAEGLEKERDYFISVGILLHTIRPVPCLIDGQQAEIPADTYVYRLRFTETEDEGIAEVKCQDGTVAEIYVTSDEVTLPYQIDSFALDEYFDNLDYSD